MIEYGLAFVTKQNDTSMQELPTSSVEVLKTVEHNLISLRGNLQVVVTRVDCASDEEVVADDDLLYAVLLLIGSRDIGSGRPEQVISKQHPKGA